MRKCSSASSASSSEPSPAECYVHTQILGLNRNVHVHISIILIEMSFVHIRVPESTFTISIRTDVSTLLAFAVKLHRLGEQGNIQSLELTDAEDTGHVESPSLSSLGKNWHSLCRSFEPSLQIRNFYGMTYIAWFYHWKSIGRARNQSISRSFSYPASWERKNACLLRSWWGRVTEGTSVLGNYAPSRPWWRRCTACG